MDFYWVYELSTWTFCLLTIGVWVVFAVGGIFAAWPFVKLLWRSPRTPESAQHHNEIVSYFLSAMGVFYGITLGLIAVGTWTTFTEIQGQVSREASALAALYRDLSGYPEPLRSDSQALLREYVDHVIAIDWPEMRRGEFPMDGTRIIQKLQEAVIVFEPATQGQAVVHAEAYSKFNELVEMRRLRLEAVDAGLPAAMWTLVFFGGLLNVAVTWLFITESKSLHVILVAMLGALIGLLVFMMAEMDRPLRGGFGIPPHAFEIIRDQLMRAG